MRQSFVFSPKKISHENLYALQERYDNAELIEIQVEDDVCMNVWLVKNGQSQEISQL